MNWRFWDRSIGAGGDGCTEIEPLLSLYSDRMASASEARRVEAHLTGCPNCRQAMRWLEATHHVIAARPVVPPPTDLRVRIAHAIAEVDTARVPATLVKRPAARPAGRSLALRPALATGLSFAVLAAAGILWNAAGQHAARIIVKTAPPQQVAVNPPNPKMTPSGTRPGQSLRRFIPTHTSRPISVANAQIRPRMNTPQKRHPLDGGKTVIERMAFIPQDNSMGATPDANPPTRPSLTHPFKATTGRTVRPPTLIKPQPMVSVHVASKPPVEPVTQPQPKATVHPQPPPDAMVATTNNVPTAHVSLPQPERTIRPSDIRVGPMQIRPDAPAPHVASADDVIRSSVRRMHEVAFAANDKALRGIAAATGSFSSDSSGTAAVVQSPFR